MWRFARCFFIFFVVVLFDVEAAKANSGQIQLGGIVKPQISIYVDEAGEISSIVNNSSSAAPEMFYSKKTNQEIPISPQLREKFLFIKSRYPIEQYGEVYGSSNHLDIDSLKAGIYRQNHFRPSLLDWRIFF